MSTIKFIDTKTHGYLDYLVSVALIAAPWVLDFYRDGAETWLPVILGVGTIVYSLLTDYELGVSRQISMRKHLMLDLFSGVILGISPWLFGFADYVWAPHLILGILEIGVALMTRTAPDTEGKVRTSRRVHLR